MTDQLDVITTAGANFKRYKDGDFNATLANVSVGPRYRFDWGYLGLYATADNSWAADEDQARSLGGLLSGNIRLGNQDVMFADFACSQRRFSTDWRNSDLSFQDGHVCAVSGRFEHYFDNTMFVRALSSYGQERTGRSHLDNDSWMAGAGVYKEIPWGISLYLQAAYTNKDYDGIYPTVNFARHDNRWDFSTNLTKRDLNIFGFAPQLQYTYTLNHSNVSIFEYDAHSLNLTFTKNF